MGIVGLLRGEGKVGRICLSGGAHGVVGSSRRAFVNFASFKLPKYRHSAHASLLSLLLTVSTKSVDNPVENLK